MIDSNERLTYLDTRHTKEATKRIIKSIISAYIDIKKKNNKELLDQEFYQARFRGMRNSLFLKYTGIEFEDVTFVNNYNDRKLPRITDHY